MDALATVFDPELGLSVVDLGLVYDLDIRDGIVRIIMTLTAPGCPIHDVMPEWIRNVVIALPGVDHVEVTITFDPPWTPELIGRHQDLGRRVRDPAGSSLVERSPGFAGRAATEEVSRKAPRSG
jgi:metal-sulfur cluster biosynthetic enzyme